MLGVISFAVAFSLIAGVPRVRAYVRKRRNARDQQRWRDDLRTDYNYFA